MKKIYSLVAALALCASAQAETIELTAQLNSGAVMYQAGLEGWSMEFTDDSESYVICTLIQSEAFTGASMTELVGTYTMDNLSPYLSFITSPDYSLWVEFADAAITVSGDDATGYQFDMEITGSDANLYKINAQLGTLTITDEKDAEFGQVDMLKHYEEEGDWYIKMSNDEYNLNLDIRTVELDGTYAASDFDPMYTFADDKVNGETYLYVVQAEVNILTQDDVTTISGWVVLETGLKLNIHATYGTEDVVGIETLTGNTMRDGKTWCNGTFRINRNGRSYGIGGEE